MSVEIQQTWRDPFRRTLRESVVLRVSYPSYDLNALRHDFDLTDIKLLTVFVEVLHENPLESSLLYFRFLPRLRTRLASHPSSSVCLVNSSVSVVIPIEFDRLHYSVVSILRDRDRSARVWHTVPVLTEWSWWTISCRVSRTKATDLWESVFLFPVCCFWLFRHPTYLRRWSILRHASLSMILVKLTRMSTFLSNDKTPEDTASAPTFVESCPASPSSSAAVWTLVVSGRHPSFWLLSGVPWARSTSHDPDSRWSSTSHLSWCQRAVLPPITARDPSHSAVYSPLLSSAAPCTSLRFNDNYVRQTCFPYGQERVGITTSHLLQRDRDITKCFWSNAVHVRAARDNAYVVVSPCPVTTL